MKFVVVSSEKVSFSGEKVSFRILKVTFSGEKVSFSWLKVTFSPSLGAPGVPGDTTFFVLVVALNELKCIEDVACRNC